MIAHACDYRNALAVAVEIIAGFGGLSLLVGTLFGGIWLCAKAGVRL